MTDFEMWQSNLEEQAKISAAAAIAAAASAEPTHPELVEIDKEVLELCSQYSEVDVLASDALVEPDPFERALTFTKDIVSDCTVEGAYKQLVGISERLCEELMAMGWGQSLDNIEKFVDPIKYAHDAHNMPGMASTIARNMSSFKAGCEASAHNAMKTHHGEAGELFLLMALCAQVLSRALDAVYDC